MTINYPFNRITKADFFQSKDVVTITGQLITEAFVRPSSSEEEDDKWIEDLNPQVLEVSYLLRYELETLSDQSIYFLTQKKKRSFDEILRAAQVIREEIWTQNDEWISSGDFEGAPTDYYTGAQAQEIGPKSYRTWSIYSDPGSALETVPDDWLDQKIWQVSKPWTWLEIYAVLCLWMIDESTVYLNLNNPHKASIWLMRASNEMHSVWLTDSPSEDAGKTLARRGGLGKKAKYQPLKDLVIERVGSKKFHSRRNAAYSLAPEVVAKARELEIGLSEQQAPITITKWLKEFGLPANK
jgi:hypothetical protein